MINTNILFFLLYSKKSILPIFPWKIKC